MAEKNFNTRMQQKIDTAANWAKATNFVPKKGEIIVYSDGGGVGVPKIKIGDGTTVVGSLKFIESDGGLSAGAIQINHISAAAQEALVLEAVSSVNVGGRNLLKNSDFAQGRLVAWGACPTVQKTGSDDLTRNFVDLAYNAWSLYQDVMLKANTRYTLSMDARLGLGTGESPVTVKLDTSNIQLTTQSVTSGYFKNGKRVYVSFTYGATSKTERIYLRSVTVEGRIIQVANIKLEEGNCPTDWTPAPEDTQHETSSHLVLQSTAWTGSGPYSAVLSCSHITADNTVIVSMAAPVSQVQYETFCKAQITANAQADGSISFTAYGTKPTINLPIAITTLGG